MTFPLRFIVSAAALGLAAPLAAQATDPARAPVQALDDGLLDAARLARVVVEPARPLAFKRETESVFPDTVVALLLDSSGSMRGRSIAVAAVCAEILGRALERCGVKVEILGFTTRSWKGGEPRDRWLAAGRPAAPGRRNQLRHIVYKSADVPWRRAREQSPRYAEFTSAASAGASCW